MLCFDINSQQENSGSTALLCWTVLSERHEPDLTKFALKNTSPENVPEMQQKHHLIPTQLEFKEQGNFWQNFPSMSEMSQNWYYSDYLEKKFPHACKKCPQIQLKTGSNLFQRLIIQKKIFLVENKTIDD
jgi:hypothetical protein